MNTKLRKKLPQAEYHNYLALVHINCQDLIVFVGITSLLYKCSAGLLIEKLQVAK